MMKRHTVRKGKEYVFTGEGPLEGKVLQVDIRANGISFVGAGFLSEDELMGLMEDMELMSMGMRPTDPPHDPPDGAF